MGYHDVITKHYRLWEMILMDSWKGNDKKMPQIQEVMEQKWNMLGYGHNGT